MAALLRSQASQTKRRNRRGGSAPPDLHVEHWSEHFSDDEEFPPYENAAQIEAIKELGSRLNVDFTHWKTLGSGTFGNVVSGMRTKANGEEETVAIKSIKTAHMTPEELARLPTEIEIWKQLNHANIVRLYSEHKIEQNVYVIMEYGSKGDLLSYLLDHGELDEQHAKGFFKQIVTAIVYMHDLGFAHRDIKADNIIMFPGNVLKVTDFTLATKVDGLSETFCGTIHYSAPEVWLQQKYCPYLADSWSLGIVLFCMLAGGFPYTEEEQTRETIVDMQAKQSYLDEIEHDFSDECMMLLRACLFVNPRLRARCRAVLASPWFE